MSISEVIDGLEKMIEIATSQEDIDLLSWAIDYLMIAEVEDDIS